MESKIFGIGLMKTGTVSCSEALKELDYSVAHFNELREIMEPTGGWLSGDFETDWLKDYDAAFDNPIPAVYPQLDRRYPNSKFILTLRDRDAWLESCRKYLAAVPAVYEYRKLVRSAVYGVFEFDEERWIYLYRKHIDDVRKYFAGRVHALLEINICNGEGWEKLCPFLGEEMPKTAFPKQNVCPNYSFK